MTTNLPMPPSPSSTLTINLALVLMTIAISVPFRGGHARQGPRQEIHLSLQKSFRRSIPPGNRARAPDATSDPVSKTSLPRPLPRRCLASEAKKTGHPIHGLSRETGSWQHGPWPCMESFLFFRGFPLAGLRRRLSLDLVSRSAIPRREFGVSECSLGKG